MPDRSADAKGGAEARSRSWLGLGALALCIALLLPSMGRFVATSAVWLDYPYPRAGSEGLILYESLLLKQGGDIYAPITPQQFISGPYPPVYYWLAAATLPNKLPDFSSPAGVTSVFRGGRSISLLAALLTAALIPLITLCAGRYTQTRRGTLTGTLGGLAGAMLFLSLPQTVVWATRFRGDMLMLAFTAAGLLCIALAERLDSSLITRHSSLITLSLAALFFSLAFFTKQTALAGPVASAAYLLWRDWKRGLLWCLLMAAAMGAPFLLLDVATGHWFFLKMVTYHSLPLRGITLTRLLQFAFWEDQWPIIVLAGAYALYMLFHTIQGRRIGQPARYAPSLPAVFTLAALAFLPTGAVVGADHNHLLMPGLGIALSAGTALAALASNLESGKATPYIAALLVAVGLVATHALLTSPPSSWYDPDLIVPSADVQEQYRKIVLNVHQNPGSLFFSDDPGIVALAGKQTPYDDPFTMTALAQAGRWDESAYRRQLQSGKFSLLVLSCDVSTPQFCRADTFTPGVFDAVKAGYEILFRDILYTYAPR